MKINAAYILDIVALCYLGGLLITGTMVNFYRKKPFLYAIGLTIVIILAEAMTILAGNAQWGMRNVQIVFNVIGFSLTPLIPIALSAIFDTEFLRSNKWLLIPTLVNAVAALLSPLYGIVFYVDAGNQYVRGDFFLLFVAVYIFNMLFLVFSTLRVAYRNHYPITRKVIALTFFTVAGTSIQILEPSLYFSWHCVTLSVFLYFTLLSEFDSSFDPLTGLYNRAAFDKIPKQTTNQKAFSIVVLDIDDFKNVNDSYGHDYGDTVLKTVAAVIRDSFDKHFVCYRIGGDEFSVIGSVTDPERIAYHLENMTNALAEKRAIDSHLPTVAAGFSIFHGGKAAEYQKYFNDADDQMYKDKRRHKDATMSQP